MEVTMKSNMIIPEVMSDMVEEGFGRRITLLPLTQIDEGLSGKPGDTLTFPAFRYIGKAEEVTENGQVPCGVLSADTVNVTVKKYAKAVRITDEARLSGLGDPLGEAADQLARAIDHAVDDALFEALRGADYSRRSPAGRLDSAAVADALTLFGEEQEGEKVLLTDPEGFSRLRRDPEYLRCGDLAQKAVFSGEAGEIWGCRIVITSAVREDREAMEKQHFILKPGALRLVNKTGTQVEVQREPEFMRDTVYCSKHCAVYLYDPGKLVALTEYTGLGKLDAGCGIRLTGEGAQRRIEIPDHLLAGEGAAWLYTPSDSAQPEGVFGQPIVGAESWQGSEALISTGGMAYVHLYLTGTDLKPVKVITLSVGA